jgi:hypothetical protein
MCGSSGAMTVEREQIEIVVFDIPKRVKQQSSGEKPERHAVA